MQDSSTTISTLTVPTALTDPRNVINRPLHLQIEIVRACPALPKSASSLLSAGPSTASLQGPSPLYPAGGGQSQGHGPTGKSATGIDARKTTWLAGGLGLSGAISYAESTMSTRTTLARRRAYKYMAALQEETDTHSIRPRKRLTIT